MGRKRKTVTASHVAGTTSKTPASSNVALRRSNRLKSPPLRSPCPIAEHVNLDANEDEEDSHRPKNDNAAAAASRGRGQKPVPENRNIDENGKEKNNRVPEEEEEEEEDSASGESSEGEEKKNPEKNPQVEEVIDLQAADETEYLVQSGDEYNFDNDNAVATRSIGGPSQDLSYKSLYIRAQKKIEVLMEEKFALLQELQFARGQITAFEKMKDMFTTREVIVVPALPNATTSAAFSAQGRLQNHIFQPAADDLDPSNASPKPKTYKRKPRRN